MMVMLNKPSLVAANLLLVMLLLPVMAWQDKEAAAVCTSACAVQVSAHLSRLPPLPQGAPARGTPCHPLLHSPAASPPPAGRKTHKTHCGRRGVHGPGMGIQQAGRARHAGCVCHCLPSAAPSARAPHRRPYSLRSQQHAHSSATQWSMKAGITHPCMLRPTNCEQRKWAGQRMQHPHPHPNTPAPTAQGGSAPVASRPALRCMVNTSWGWAAQ